MSEAAGHLTWMRKFGLGGLGGLLPIFVDLLTMDIADIASVVDHPQSMTIGIYIGYSLRTMILFSLGGIMAALNSDIHKPFTLLQLGVVAPALVTSYTNGVPTKALLSKYKISAMIYYVGAISTAYAESPAIPDKTDKQDELKDSAAKLLIGGIILGLLGYLSVKGDHSGADSKNSDPHYLVLNKKTGGCVTIPTTRSVEVDINQLQKLFPLPDYEVHSGICPGGRK